MPDGMVLFIFSPPCRHVLFSFSSCLFSFASLSSSFRCARRPGCVITLCVFVFSEMHYSILTLSSANLERVSVHTLCIINFLLRISNAFRNVRTQGVRFSSESDVNSPCGLLCRWNNPRHLPEGAHVL